MNLIQMKFYSFAMSKESNLRTHNCDEIGATSASHATAAALIRNSAVMRTVDDMILCASAVEAAHHKRKSRGAVAIGARVRIFVCGCGEA